MFILIFLLRYIFDFVIVVNESKGSKATVMDVLDGKKIFAEIYVKIHLTENVPRTAEQDATKFLMKMYEDKDRVKDYYLNHGRFETPPNYKVFNVEPKISGIINTFFWFTTVWSFLIWLCYNMIENGSYYKFAFVLLFLSIAYILQMATFAQSQVLNKKNDLRNN